MIWSNTILQYSEAGDGAPGPHEALRALRAREGDAAGHAASGVPIILHHNMLYYNTFVYNYIQLYHIISYHILLHYIILY